MLQATILKQPFLQSYISSVVVDTTARNIFLNEAASFLANNYRAGRKQGQRILRAMAKKTHNEDQLNGFTQHFINDPETFRRVLPVVASSYIREHWEKAIGEILEPGPYPYPRFDPQILLHQYVVESVISYKKLIKNNK